MSVKQLTADQHVLLHNTYPGDCCLCKAQSQLALNLLDNVALREEVDQLKREIEDLRGEKK